MNKETEKPEVMYVAKGSCKTCYGKGYVIRTMMVGPMCSMFYGVGFKVEGEAERKLEEEKSVKVLPMFKFWPFKLGGHVPKIRTTD